MLVPQLRFLDSEQMLGGSVAIRPEEHRRQPDVATILGFRADARQVGGQPTGYRCSKCPIHAVLRQKLAAHTYTLV